MKALFLFIGLLSVASFSPSLARASEEGEEGHSKNVRAYIRRRFIERFGGAKSFGAKEGAGGGEHDGNDADADLNANTLANADAIAASANTPFRLDANVKLTATPLTSLSASSASVTVAWSGVFLPTKGDWIGVFSPAASSNLAFLDYIDNAAGSSSGSYTFTVPNFRSADIQFRYFSAVALYTAVAQTAPLSFAPHVPTQVRLAVAASATATRTADMMVSWNSDCAVAQCGVAQVQFGVGNEQGPFPNVANAVTHTYQADDMCGLPAGITASIFFRDPGYFHDAYLNTSSLVGPNVKVFYRVGQNGVWSDVRSFITQPLVGASVPYQFVMLADHGAVNCFRLDNMCRDAPGTITRIQQDVASISENGKTSLVLHIGDVSYAVGYGYLWDYHGAEIEPLASRVPYMIGVGNHEYDHLGLLGHDPSGERFAGWHPIWGNYGEDSGGECGVPLAQRYTAPRTGNGVFWYSFNAGPIHFILYSGEHDFTRGSRQWQWLQADLAAVDKTVTPWIVANVHRPMYASQDFPIDYTIGVHMQQELEALFKQYGVDVVLGGHYHSYERTCPVYGQACCAANETCPVHIIAGMAGIGLDKQDWLAGKTWSVFREKAHFGYLRVSVAPADTEKKASMKLEFVSTSPQDTGAIIDSSVIYKH